MNGPDSILDAVCSVGYLPAERRKLLRDLCADQSRFDALLPMLDEWESENPSAQLEPGSMVSDRYELRTRLGFGQSAVVWQAHDRDYGREVALKIFVGPQVKERWPAVQREASAMARVTSDFVVEMRTVSKRDEPIAYIDMQLCWGEDDRPVVSAEKAPPASIREAVFWIAAAARGIHAAHRVGVWHRDLKPANILVAETRANLPDHEHRRPRVTDFGLAMHDSRGASPGDASRSMTIVASGGLQIAGTPRYMAPEQARGLPTVLGARAGEILVPIDVFGLGATLFHFLIGRAPWCAEGNDDTLSLARKCELPGRPPAGKLGPVPSELWSIVRKAMEKHPADRYRAAADLARDLENFLVDRPLSMDGARRRAVLAARRNRLVLMQAATVLVVSSLLGGTAWLMSDLLKSKEQAVGEERARAATLRAGDRAAAAAELDDARRAAAQEQARLREQAAEEAKKASQAAAGEKARALEAAAEDKRRRLAAADEDKTAALRAMSAAAQKAVEKALLAASRDKQAALADAARASDLRVQEELAAATKTAAEEKRNAVAVALEAASREKQTALEQAARVADERHRAALAALVDAGIESQVDAPPETTATAQTASDAGSGPQ